MQGSSGTGSAAPDTKSRKHGIILYAMIFAFFVAGIIVGTSAPHIFPSISFLGDVYIRLLQFVMIPLVMVQIADSVYHAAGSIAGRILRILLLFVVMFAVSFAITAAVVALLQPGNGAGMFGGTWSGEKPEMTLKTFISMLVPENIISAILSGSLLPCILFAFVFGIAAARVRAEKVMHVCADIGKVLAKVLEYFMWFSPIGVFVLMGSAVSACGTQAVGIGARYVLTAWGISVIVMFAVMILPVWITAHIPPAKYVRRVWKVWLMTLSTCSSSATLPHTIRTCNEEFGVPKDVTGIVVPLGCTVHMCGGAVSFCLLGMFSMQSAGQPITTGMLGLMLLTALLLNMAAPGVPGGGVALGAVWLTMLGMPTGFIGIYGGIYRLLDMPYTTLNVTGDITANVLIYEMEKRKASRAS